MLAAQPHIIKTLFKYNSKFYIVSRNQEDTCLKMKWTAMDNK